LEKFGSIKSIVDADEKQLQEVENLGKKKARAIQKVLREKYDEKKNIYENWENEGEGNEEKAQEITLESEDEIVIDEEPSED
jgi:NAD-dependent DNA ligase